MTLKPISDGLGHLQATGYRSAGPARTHVFASDGCGEPALKKCFHEVFYKEQLAVRFVSNYKQLCRSCSSDLHIIGKLKVIQSKILLCRKLMSIKTILRTLSRYFQVNLVTAPNETRKEISEVIVVISEQQSSRKLGWKGDLLTIVYFRNSLESTLKKLNRKSGKRNMLLEKKPTFSCCLSM